MHWMGSSINISQPDIKRFMFEKPPTRETSSRYARNPASNYQYLNTISDKKNMKSDLYSRMSGVLQSSGAKNFQNGSSRRNHNKSLVQSEVKPPTYYNRNRSIDTIEIPKFDAVEKTINQSMVAEQRRAAFNRSLKQNYFEKAGYISQPIRQVKAPVVSTTKAVFG